MDLKKIFLNNLSLKISALLCALVLWISITGKQRSYSEKSMDIDVQYFNVSDKIDVRSVRPENVKITIKGTSSELKKIIPEEFKLSIDLKGISESAKLNFFSEDFIEYPEGTQVVSIHPKMIEISVEAFMSKEVPIRILYTGRLKPGVRLLERKLIPERITIFGYKSQIQNINTIYGNKKLDLSQIESSAVISIPLRKEEEVIKFKDVEDPDFLETKDVKIQIVVENKNVTSPATKKGS